MSDAPKIVRDRLRAAAPGEAHPDPDLLTAFAEQALPPGERESVVRHLARCGDCREIVALSIPPLEVVEQATAASDQSPARHSADVPRSWFAWPTLRWAAMAAAAVVVVSVLMLRPGKQSENMVTTVNRQAENAPPVADSMTQPVAPPANQPAAAVDANTAQPDNSPRRERSAFSIAEPQLGRAQTRAEAGSGIQLTENKRTDSLNAKHDYSWDERDKQELQSPATPNTNAISGIAASEQPSHSSQEAVVVNGAADVVQSAPVAGRVVAQNEAQPPIVKSKPLAKEKEEEEARKKNQLADTDMQAKLAATYSGSNTAFAARKALTKDAAPQWSLAQGTLKRSLDAGASWLITLQLQHPLLCFGARGSDVWAGGQAGTLLHSLDSGTTWTMIQPATKAESLAADIVAIEIRSPAEVVLSTSNHDSWTTADGGKTWEKK